MTTLRGIISGLAIVLNTIIVGVPMLLLALFKPIPFLRQPITDLLVAMADRWALNNRFILHATGAMNVRASGLEPLRTDRWYLVVSNHQSWVDILILHCTLTRRLSPIKFFMKQQLIWIPILGLACWALDFPFMKRYSREYLAAHPEKRGEDIETTRRACERVSRRPASMLNFLEGTRFTAAKHAAQQSPFRHLLKPKPGGFAFVITSLSERVQHLVDATIVYPHGVPSFWDYLCGRCPEALLDVQVIPVPAELRDGDYGEDAEYRAQVQQWLTRLWQQKDERIEALQLAARAAA